MTNQIFNNRIALRIDVDYPHIVPDAVYFMLDVLREHRFRATFFLSAGGAADDIMPFVKFFSPSYLRRLVRLRAWRMAGRFLSGAVQCEDALENMINKIRDEGHELAVHGWRHAWWIDNVWRTGKPELEKEISAAYDFIRQKGVSDNMAWGSPGWRTTDDVLEILEKKKVPYCSECWGREPFFAVAHDRRINIVNLPITMPSFESGVTVNDVLDQRPLDRYDMVVCHDYYEGYLRRNIFKSLINEFSSREIKTITLRQVAEGIRSNGLVLPECRLEQGKVEGFFGEVSVQGGWKRIRVNI